jgi:hypothetical protein
MQVKKCTKCNQVKSVQDFKENQYSPDGRYLICMTCFDQRVKEPPPITESIVEKQKESEITGLNGGVEKMAFKPLPPVRSTRPVMTKSASNDDKNQTKAIKQAQQEILSDTQEISHQARGLLPKLRKCNGCKRVEAVGKVPQVPPNLVQAWFCKDCISKKTHTYAGKGYLVYDYWGRAYKVSKVLDNERVRGVVKKGDGSWSTRKFSIYGQWLTKKPI